MSLHFCAELHKADFDFTYAVCECGFRTTPVPDIDLVIDEMMQHARERALIEDVKHV